MLKTLTFLSICLLTLAAAGQVKKTTAKTTTPVKTAQAPTFAPVINDVPVKQYDGLSAGSLAPDVVIIDADYIEGIINGAVIIRKGKLTALVDLKGNYIAPYGKYNIREFYYFLPIFTPLIAMQDPTTGLKGFINVNGQIVIRPIYDRIEDFDYSLMAMVSLPSRDFNQKYIDLKGNLISPLMDKIYDKSIVERTLIGNKQADLFRYVNQKVGYITRKGTIAIAPQFDNGNYFVEGLAAVAKTDQFGEKKWGYIDETGKTVIPFMFGREPGYFHEGLALVRPSTPTTFNYAYIDKKGNIKHKIGDGKYSRYTPYENTGSRANLLKVDSKMGGNFINGYSFWTNGREPFLMDTLGNFKSLSSIIKGVSPSDKREVFLDQYDDRGIFFGYGGPGSMSANTGVMDYQGNILIPPVFNQVYLDYYSRYAHAKLENFNIKNAAHKYDGIVNPQGVFVMIVGDKPTF